MPIRIDTKEEIMRKIKKGWKVTTPEGKSCVVTYFFPRLRGRANDYLVCRPDNINTLQGEKMKGLIDVPELLAPLESAGIEEVRYHHATKDQRQRSCYDGPVTVCDLIRGDETAAYGYAYLHPRDMFCRKTGRAVSLRRAFSNLDVKHRRNGK